MTCGRCQLPIHVAEIGLGYYGTYTTHAPYRCVELLKLDRDAALQRIAEMEKQLDERDIGLRALEAILGTWDHSAAIDDENQLVPHLSWKLARLLQEAVDKAELKRHLDAIAEALHLHKPVGGGWTYLPDQLAGMVRELRERVKTQNERLAAIDKDIAFLNKADWANDFEAGIKWRDEKIDALQREVAALRGLLRRVYHGEVDGLADDADIRKEIIRQIDAARANSG